MIFSSDSGKSNQSRNQFRHPTKGLGKALGLLSFRSAASWNSAEKKRHGGFGCVKLKPSLKPSLYFFGANGKQLVVNLDIDQITDEHFARIHRAALVLSGNPWDADDLAQETFLVFARQMERFQGKSSVYTYLYGILLNLDRRERRRLGMNRKKLKVMWDQEPQGDPTMPAAEASIEAAEWKRSLWSKLDELPDPQRHALVLRFSEGLRYEAIAETLECPLGTVKSRIFHGLSSLRRILDGDLEEIRDLPDHINEDEARAM